ncbi:unnamed protein product [Auanema sp. JU1783]|nr:unnamed protein product [Auanema sp. JU1783]
MAPTAVNGTPSPERAFSYADAAKKSSDSTGGRDHSPSESAKPNSHHNDISSKAVEIVGSQGSSGAEIPNGTASSTGLSFFYDENEATNTDHKPSEDNAFVLNLGGKTVRFAKGLAANNVEPNQRHLSMIELMTQRWESFLKGPAPMHYTAKPSPV